MFMPGRRPSSIVALAAAAVMAPAFALASDEVVSTARLTGAPPAEGPSAEDILSRLEAIPSRDSESEVAPPFAERRADRKPHGSMGVAIGTGGYRSIGGDVVIPLGENGTLGLAVELTEGRRGYYRHGGHGRP